MITATRYHDFSYGHRVVGHEGKCKCLHGHNGRVHFTCTARADMPQLDSIGRVVDFSVIKSALCEWLEVNWDHKMLIWTRDPHWNALVQIDKTVVLVPFNPTAENMAKHLVETIGPLVLPAHVELVEVTFEETSKCSATYTKD